MFFSYLIILFATCNSTTDYVKSIFGHPGRDEVENEFVDGVEILQRNLPKPATNHIKNAKFSSSVIPDDNYPWPGHNFQGDNTWTLLKEERSAVKSFYDNKVDLTQNQVYWHPAAAKCLYSTNEIIQNAERVKIKMIMRPQYRCHILPGIFPPGEIVTIEIPESMINMITITTNPQTRDINEKNNDAQYKQRLPWMTITTKLTQKVNKVGNPYGGVVSFSLSGSDPIEITVSNIILMPTFIYGYTSDEDWDYQVKNYPGPYAFIDTGNLVHLGPKSSISSTIRMNDVQHYWRSAIQISQTTARDYKLNNNPRFGRFISPCIMKYDSFVPAGAAVAFGAGNFVHCPPSWFGTVTNWENTINLPWGTLHEINHNRQEDYANSQPGHGEMSNNMINLVVIAKTNTASSERSTSVWGSYTYASHFLNTVTANDGLPRYSNMIHFFGPDLYKKFIEADQEDLYYKDGDYGYSGSELLQASKIFNRDMHYHWNFHGTTDTELNSKNDTLEELKKLNLKPFHPVTNIFAVGLVHDGKDIYTARPYRIPPWEQNINFTSAIVQRDNKEWFGDFEFHSAVFENGREKAWKATSKGAYRFTPKEDPSAIEEVRVNYLDKTTKEIHTVICQFTTLHNNNYAKFTRYAYIPTTMDNIFKAYRYVVHNSTDENILETKIVSMDLGQVAYQNKEILKWLLIYEGMISPPETANYIFSETADLQGLFYLSEEPLKGDPDLDSEYMINYQPTGNMDFKLANHSKPVHLEADKFYYFRQIIYPTWNAIGRGYVGYKKEGDTGDFRTVPKSWLRYRQITNEYKFEHQFKPDFERIYLMDEWNQLIKNDQSGWNVYTVPWGHMLTNANIAQGSGAPGYTPTSILTDGDDTTDYRANWYTGGKQNLPHIYEIDMNQTETFDTIRLKGCGNYEWFGMNAYIEIYLGTHNYQVTNTSEILCEPDNCSINHPESLIWEGMFNTQSMEFIEFKKELSGKYIKIRVVNNTKKWKDGSTPRSDFSSIEVGYMPNNKKIYPITNTRYVTRINRWNETHAGAYYNGIGLTGYKDSILKIRIPKLKPEIGIIGDYYPDMGTAIVKIDGTKVGTIHDSYDVQGDKRRLTKASRSHMSLLFYYKNLNPSTEHTLTIEVIDGQITLAGLLTHQMVVKYLTDDYRYPRILETEFNENPEQYDWFLPSDQIGPYVPKQPKSKKNKTGMIVGIVFAVIAVIAIAAVVTFFVIRKKKTASSSQAASFQSLF